MKSTISLAQPTVGLQDTEELCRVYGDRSRLRLLALLTREELSVAELTAATRLAQSRVSSHLGKLREARLVRLRRAGTSTYYSLDEAGMSPAAARLWRLLREDTLDPLLDEDRERLADVLSARGETWADAVAGQMERHYSPGRTWEAAARCLVGLSRLGDVLDVASGDGALAELVQPRARSVTCLDSSSRVVRAARRRLGHLPRVRLTVGDMHALPLPDAGFDHVMLVNSLSYARQPERVVAEAARVLRPGGDLVAVTLRAHRHAAVAEAYDHVQMGFQPEELAQLFVAQGLDVSRCEVTSRERRAPHFEIVTVHARRLERPTPASYPPSREDSP